jgi:hypothetical protein
MEAVVVIHYLRGVAVGHADAGLEGSAGFVFDIFNPPFLVGSLGGVLVS